MELRVGGFFGVLVLIADVWAIVNVFGSTASRYERKTGVADAAPEGAETWNFPAPDEGDYRYPLTGFKTLVNVGSVGQPRDGNPNACYVILDDGGNSASSSESGSSGPRGERSITYRRVAYPKEVTRDKIYGIAELDNMLGDRLMSGR